MGPRVAVTGLGAVTPLGTDVATTWAGLVAGRSGVGPITTFDAETFPIRIAGQVRDFSVASSLPGPGYGRHLSRAAGFGFAAAAEAMRQAGAEGCYAPHEAGIAMGASAGRPEEQELTEVMTAYRRSDGHDIRAQRPTGMLLRQQNVGVEAIARRWRLEGPMIGVSTACSASTHAIGEAFRHIQEGDAKLVVAGGYDSLTTWLDVLGFTLLGALAAGFEHDPAAASMPFDRERRGFVLGEGAVALVLEDLAAARARGAEVLAEITGYGTSLNAYRITDAPPDGTGPAESMARALADAGARPSEVDCVVAHGTSTPGNDLCETAALKTVLGEFARGVPVTAPKSMTGHLTAASGALNALVAIQAIRTSVIPPTINLRTPDPKLDLDYVPNRARRAPVRTALANAFAFGGTNGTLVLGAGGGS
ncbi:beta-ketoacyl-[acyl-carrier-protein] synthase family protein [Amycolatopsis sp. NPDC026612]|uniref:beta-ketoacyl-[acyl-carrier-protein] synthase family protein n=1 Tax=Amycolatopsis sp. NPDC026612 TaxID=3155466 RepID=UPI0033CF909E